MVCIDTAGMGENIRLRVYLNIWLIECGKRFNAKGGAISVIGETPVVVENDTSKFNISEDLPLFAKYGRTFKLKASIVV